MKTRASRYHDISCGHRVAGHESKCQHLHGHNYRIHFHCEGELDTVGRVLDFSVIKSKLCMWVEDNWDHKFLVWEDDVLMQRIATVVDAWCRPIRNTAEKDPPLVMFEESIVWLPFNPTAENMAQFLVNIIGPQVLQDTGVTLVRVDIEETRKCSASYSI